MTNKIDAQTQTDTILGSDEYVDKKSVATQTDNIIKGQVVSFDPSNHRICIETDKGDFLFRTYHGETRELSQALLKKNTFAFRDFSVKNNPYCSIDPKLHKEFSKLQGFDPTRQAGVVLSPKHGLTLYQAVPGPYDTLYMWDTFDSKGSGRQEAQAQQTAPEQLHQDTISWVIPQKKSELYKECVKFLQILEPSFHNTYKSEGGDYQWLTDEVHIGRILFAHHNLDTKKACIRQRTGKKGVREYHFPATPENAAFIASVQQQYINVPNGASQPLAKIYENYGTIQIEPDSRQRVLSNSPRSKKADTQTQRTGFIANEGYPQKGGR